MQVVFNGFDKFFNSALFRLVDSKVLNVRAVLTFKALYVTLLLYNKGHFKTILIWQRELNNQQLTKSKSALPQCGLLHLGIITFLRNFI